MIKQILYLLASTAVLASCHRESTPMIDTLCSQDDIGNYLIKWETESSMTGTVKLYVSNTPDHFNMSEAALSEDIDKGVMTYITDDNLSRKYFLLSFNDKLYLPVGSSRAIAMDSIQNFRDLGGYYNVRNNRSTRWGKIFRSGDLTAISNRDSSRLDNLGIKTIIDFRDEKKAANHPFKYSKAKILNFPVPFDDEESVEEKILKGEMRKGDVQLYMQGIYLSFVDKYSASFAKALRIFLDKQNYPILISCDLGKDRVGFLTALLLAAADVSEETIREDFMLSNDYINIKHLSYLAHELNTDSQEAATVLLTVNASSFDLAFNQIKKEYGTMDKYLSKKMHLTEKEQREIKEIVLH
jgi:protein tyrosine/serine phosphatase